ncbi:MAG TPA: hypothetical protein VK762_01395, partial [Polyangiaceae bacterium]|nr:hypothetical protein [Polyangiaceae bacterium]
ALGHAVGANGGVTWRFLSQREVVRRVHRVWARSRIASGDVAYVTGEVPSLATTVAVLAFTADGHTQVVIGTKADALEEIGMTRPHKIIAPVETVRQMLESTPSPDPSSRLRRWLARASFLPTAFRSKRDEAPPSALPGRVRWLSTGSSLALSLRARARKFVILEIDESLA